MIINWSLKGIIIYNIILLISTGTLLLLILRGVF